MWCSVCERDIDPIKSDPHKIEDCRSLRGCVPLLPTVPLIACPDCGTLLGNNKALSANPPTTVPMKMHLMCWELDEQLSDVRRLLASQDHRRSAGPCFSRSSSLKLTMRSETRHYFDTHNTSLARSANNTKMAPRISADVWRIVLPGGAAFTFGFVLLVWSVLSSRLEWWNVGLAAMLTGQSALLIAAILLVQHVRHGNRDLSAKIDATIGGLHVLRKEKGSACPTSPSPESSTYLFNDRNLQQRFSEIRKQIAKVQRSLAE